MIFSIIMDFAALTLKFVQWLFFIYFLCKFSLAWLQQNLREFSSNFLLKLEILDLTSKKDTQMTFSKPKLLSYSVDMGWKAGKIMNLQINKIMFITACQTLWKENGLEKLIAFIKDQNILLERLDWLKIALADSN